MGTTEIQEGDPSWGIEAKTLWAQVQEGWSLGPDGVAMLRTGCDSLSRYHQAARVLAEEGLTVRAGDLVRKHPCTEIAKNSLAGFLSAMRALDLEGDEKKPLLGRPTTYELEMKRARV